MSHASHEPCTCVCCGPAARRAKYASRRAESGRTVRSYRPRAAPAALEPRPGLDVDPRGFVIRMHPSPKILAAKDRAAADIGPQYRDASGRVLWGKVTEPELRALRTAVEAPAEEWKSIPPGLIRIDEHGRAVIDEDILATRPPTARRSIDALLARHHIAKAV